MASLACGFSVQAVAAMTLEQMKSFRGTAQLEMTVDSLLASCGLPAAIMDGGPADGAKQHLNWQGAGMRLSTLDWDVVYGKQQREPGKHGGWTNRKQYDLRCASGLSQLQFHAKGHVGVLSVTKKPHDSGYTTTYAEPKNLYKAHKVVSFKAVLAKGLPVSTLISRYGQPDQVLKRPGGGDQFRYWVLTLRDRRPESLHAVDFEIDNAIARSYAIGGSDVDFVQQRLDTLLKQWERDYVLD